MPQEILYNNFIAFVFIQRISRVETTQTVFNFRCDTPWWSKNFCHFPGFIYYVVQCARRAVNTGAGGGAQYYELLFARDFHFDRGLCSDYGVGPCALGTNFF